MGPTQAMVVAFAVLAETCGAARADEPSAKAILDKAIMALGGEEKLAKVEAFSWKAKVEFGINGRRLDAEVTFKGIDHMRRVYGANLVVLAGDKGWRKVGNAPRALPDAVVASEKRSAYLQVLPVILLPIKRNEFKYEAAGQQNVDDKPALGLKITAPDGKDFTLFFDKETGLPVKEVARLDIQGANETIAETYFSDYKDFGGIKKATRIEVKTSGFGSGFSQVITDFKFLDKVDDGTFAEPK